MVIIERMLLRTWRPLVQPRCFRRERVAARVVRLWGASVMVVLVLRLARLQMRRRSSYDSADRTVSRSRSLWR